METLLMWIVGLLTGAGLLRVYQRIRNKNIALKWYHWLIGVVWYASGLFIILFITTSFAENAPQAAGMAILIFGGAFLVLTILLYRFVYGRRVKKIVAN